MAACPKCGKTTEPTARICPFCGVIMSKVRGGSAEGSADAPSTPGRRPPPLRPQPFLPARTAGLNFQTDHVPRPQTSGIAALVKVALVAAVSIAAAFVLTRGKEEALPATPIVAVPEAGQTKPIEPPNAENLRSLSRADVEFLNELIARLGAAPYPAPSADEIQRVERIVTENPDLTEVKSLLMGVYIRGADHELRAESFGAVEVSLGRMKLLNDQYADIYALEAFARARQEDWSAVVQAAQRYEDLAGPASIGTSLTLAVALDRVGRRPDALAVLDRPVFDACRNQSGGADAAACRSAEQMRKALAAAAAAAEAPAAPEDTRARAALAVDPSKDRIHSERFDVRFDGENQSGVARDVGIVLDRAYVRLADIYYERPSRRIPVVLHSSRDYHTATGAPWWSGGVYSSHDGAIQIPVRGLPSTLPREMEDVLVHELSHAFVDEMSGGYAGRVIQEGLAQYMEGKRIEEELSPAELRRLATSQKQNVMSFYMLSLAVTQSLVQSHGQGRINDLLKAMKETRSEDGAYVKLFGRSRAVMEKDILEVFWKRYS